MIRMTIIFADNIQYKINKCYTQHGTCVGRQTTKAQYRNSVCIYSILYTLYIGFKAITLTEQMCAQSTCVIYT